MFEVSTVGLAEAVDDVGVLVAVVVTKTVVAADGDEVALARSAWVLCRFRWLTPNPALSPMTAASRIMVAASRARHVLLFTPDELGALGVVGT